MAQFVILTRTSFEGGIEKVAVNLDFISAVEPSDDGGIRVITSIFNKSSRSSEPVEFEASESFDQFAKKSGAK